VKAALLVRLSHRFNRTGQRRTHLRHRRLVARMTDIQTFPAHLHLAALRQGLETAPQVVGLSDGARGFGRLFEACFSHLAVGILDFYHAAAHLWQAAEAYQDGNPARTPQMWFTRLRHQLRHGYVHRILRELRWLSARPTPLLRPRYSCGGCMTIGTPIKLICSIGSSSNRATAGLRDGRECL